jgi:predicted unusual protein kinase regulating ubiquinone biosynthesis (AarF/ABC1/UbiB family)
VEILQNKKRDQSNFKSRKQELKQRLIEFGLIRQGHFHRHRESADVGEGADYTRKLRQALTSLGPVFASFGLYLSSRVDLLPVSDCLELAMIPDRADWMPISTVRALIVSELGDSQEEIYPIFEEVPFESRLMFQLHRAVLESGERVTVKIVNPEAEAQLESELESLSILKNTMTGKAWSRIPLDAVIADFHRTVQRQLNLTHEVEAFEKLAQDAVEFEMLKVPEVYTDLCSSKISTTEQLRGSTLKAVIDAFEKKRSEGSGATSVELGATRFEAKKLATNLCVLWLRQALLGSLFPTELRPENIIVLPDKQITFTGGEFISLTTETKQNLSNYLIAASTEAPDEACSYLLREMIDEQNPFDEEELQHRFREVVPFRDGGWDPNGDSNSLAEHLFLHWKLVHSRGRTPQPHLICFYRGLFQAAAHAQRIAPNTDSLLRGLQDVRTIEMFSQFREMMQLRQFSENFDKYAVMMMRLPKTLDDVLTLLAESGAYIKNAKSRKTEHRHQKNRSILVIVLLLVLAAVVLLSHHLATALADSAWIERMGTLVFVVVSALLLRVASRAR